MTSKEWKEWYLNELSLLEKKAVKRLEEIKYESEMDAIISLPILCATKNPFNFDKYFRNKRNNFCKVKENDVIIIREINKENGQISESKYKVLKVYHNYKGENKYEYSLYLCDYKTIDSRFQKTSYFSLQNNNLVKIDKYYIYSIEIIK